VPDYGPGGVLLIGIGNVLRRDDGAGIEVARRLADGKLPPGIEVREHQGEATYVLDAWDGRDAVVLVDTLRSGAAPGTIRRLDASEAPLPAGLRGTSSTHAIALGESIELARALGGLPPRVVVYAVEGRRFEAGAGLSEEVKAAVPALAGAALREARSLAGC
jgi:hydrogenase maturation protease